MSSYNIQRSKTTLVLAYATNATTISASVGLNGLLRGIQVLAPDLDSTNTYSITITDADGFTIYTKASLTENTRTTAYVDANNQPLQLPLSGTHTITIVTSGSQTTDRTFSVVLLVDRG